MQIATESELKEIIVNTALESDLTLADFEFFGWLLWSLDLCNN